MSGLIVKPRSRIFHGHEWVFSSEVKTFFGDPQPGDTITLKDYRDRPLGTAIFQPHSQVVARRFSRRKQSIDHEFLQRRISQAIELRENYPTLESSPCRLVWSDSDGLPGVIVDQYGEHILLQVSTLAMYQKLELIVEVLTKLLSPTSITLCNHAHELVSEGIPQETRTLYGEDQKTFLTQVGSTHFEVDVYQPESLLPLQQLDLYNSLHSHAALQQYIKGKNVLILYAGNGALATSCAKAGATKVTAVDRCEHTQTLLKRNAELNSASIDSIQFDVLAFLKRCDSHYDAVIIDLSRSTVPTKKLKDLLKNLKELHTRSLELLTKDGTLTTLSAHPQVHQRELLELIVDSAVSAKKTLRLLTTHQQRADHPILPAMSETCSFKGYTLQLAPNR